MSGKKQYYKLDEVGFVGTQEKISVSERRKIQEKTAEHIRNEKLKKTLSKKRA